MKNAMMAVLFLVGTIGFSQERQEPQPKRGPRVELTPEQRNDLQLKRLTLDLNLNASQQKEMGKIIADQQTKRAAAMAKMKENRDKNVKPTADDVYAMESKRLDEKIETKAKLKKLLDKEQFAKWEKIDQRHDHKFRAHKPGGFPKDGKPSKKHPEPQE